MKSFRSLDAINEMINDGTISEEFEVGVGYIKFLKTGDVICYGSGQMTFSATATNVYGTTSGDINDAMVEVALPIDFVDTNYTVTLTPHYGKVHGCRVPTKSVDSFEAWGYYVTGATDTTFDWIAVGKFE